MDKALDEMLDRVRSWPEDRQRDVVRTLEDFEAAGTEPYRLSEAELELLREAEMESERGEFATEEEVKAFFERLEKG